MRKKKNKNAESISQSTTPSTNEDCIELTGCTFTRSTSLSTAAIVCVVSTSISIVLNTEYDMICLCSCVAHEFFMLNDSTEIYVL